MPSEVAVIEKQHPAFCPCHHSPTLDLSVQKKLHSWVSSETSLTQSDSFSLQNMQMRPVAPPWLVFSWKSTDTSICLVRGRKKRVGGRGTGGEYSGRRSGGENGQIGVTVSYISACGWCVSCELYLGKKNHMCSILFCSAFN